MIPLEDLVQLEAFKTWNFLFREHSVEKCDQLVHRILDSPNELDRSESVVYRTSYYNGSMSFSNANLKIAMHHEKSNGICRRLTACRKSIAEHAENF